MRSIGSIIVSMDLEDVKNVLRHIFIIAFYETDGQNYNDELIECEYLKQRVATHDTEFDENINIIKDVNESMTIYRLTTYKIHLFLKKFMIIYLW